MTAALQYDAAAPADEALALRARRHAYAAAVARLPSTPTPQHKLVQQWEALRDAWAALPEAEQRRADDEFRARHRCAGGSLMTCTYARRAE